MRANVMVNRRHHLSLAKKRKPDQAHHLVSFNGNNNESTKQIEVKKNFDAIDELLKEDIDTIVDDEDQDLNPDQPTPRDISATPRAAVSSPVENDTKSKLSAVVNAADVAEQLSRTKQAIDEANMSNDLNNHASYVQDDENEGNESDERRAKKTKYTSPRMQKNSCSEPDLHSEEKKRSKTNQPQTASHSRSAARISRAPIELDDLSFVDRTKYTPLNMIGSGSYGKVFKAVEKSSNKHVAIKLIGNVFKKTEDSKRIYREIFLLKRLQNPYLIKLRDIIVPLRSSEEFSRLALVFDFVDTDLFNLVRSNQFLRLSHVQFIMFQLMNALNYLHANKIVHRDLKPANVLIFSNCKIKICDFGLARVIDDSDNMVDENEQKIEEELLGTDESPESAEEGVDQGNNTTEAQKTLKNTKHQKLEKKLTRHVVTRWYRAPELILILKYDTKIDIWSAGCILGELLHMIHTPFMKRMPMFPGKSCFPLTQEHGQVYKNKTDQLNVIFKILGTPAYDDVKDMASVKGYLMSLPKLPAVDFRAMYPGIHPTALELLSKLLVFNPKRRLTAEEGLKTDFFQMKRKFDVTVEKCVRNLKECELNCTHDLSVDEYKKLVRGEATMECQGI